MVFERGLLRSRQEKRKKVFSLGPQKVCRKVIWGNYAVMEICGMRLNVLVEAQTEFEVTLLVPGQVRGKKMSHRQMLPG